MVNKKHHSGDHSTLFGKAMSVVSQQVIKKKPLVGEFDQMSARAGIKSFGAAAIAAMIKEFLQLDKGAFPGKPVVEPVNHNSILTQEQKEVLEAVNLIKKKQSGMVKGRNALH